jgi:branched-chain amino acid transport system ATP-binding protein
MIAAAVSAESLYAGYDGVPVVRDFNVRAAEGEIVALLGPNGAGKTTILLTMAGLLPPIDGEVCISGERLPSRRPHEASRRGLALVSDDRALFSTMTVRENLEVARRRNGMTVDEVLAVFPALRSRLKVRVGMISGGEQQMVAVARALIQQPRVLLVDEMSAGLAPLIVRELFESLRQAVTETGMTIILVEQHVDLALANADRAIVLVHGEVVLTGTAQEIRADSRQLEEAYLSHSVTSRSEH